MTFRAVGSMAAVIIGGTGATGKCLVRTLLQAKDKVGKVTLLSRRPLPPVEGVDLSAEESQGRLVQHVEGLDTVSDDKVKELCSGGTVFFNTMGTNLTLLLTGSPSEYRRVAYDIPARLTRLAHQANIPHCSILTAVIADPNNSWSMYARTKGQLEDIGKELFPHVSTFRAGHLDRGEDRRFLERVGFLFIKGMPVSTLAEAMFLDALEYHKKRQSAQTPEGDGGTTAAPEDSNTIDVFYDNDVYRICKKRRLMAEQ